MNDKNLVINWEEEIAKLDSSEKSIATSEILSKALTINNENTQYLKTQIHSLLAKLKQAYHVIKDERTEKQNTVALLKEKLHEIHNLQGKINTMNETIKCCQEHIAIERDNYHSTKNKIVYITSTLQTAEKTITQKDALIQNLKTEHETSMRKAKMLIEEFYRYKFLEEITYSDIENIELLSERELIEEAN